MSYTPISKHVPQWDNESTGLPYESAVLKAYSAGTSTNISMATDYTGGTTATSMVLNSAGYPEVSGNIVIPHVNEDYKLALYPTQAAADANSGAIWSIDNLPAGAAFASMTSHVKAESVYIEDDVGAGATAFDIDANIAAAWESVGPTGSGATNIWTAMDNIPDGAKFAELRIANDCTDSAAANITQVVYLRVTGSSTAIGAQTAVSEVTLTATGATATQIKNITTAKVPLDSSKRFDIFFTADGTSRAVNAYLVGVGV